MTDNMCPAMREDGLMGKVPCVAEKAMYDGKPALSCLYCGKGLEGFPPQDFPKRLPEFTMDRNEYIPCFGPNWPRLEWSDKLLGCGGRGTVAPNHPNKGMQMTNDPNDGFICGLCHGTGFLRLKDLKNVQLK